MEEDPYKILGVSRDASEDQVKSAYRRLAKKYHPDLHPGDAEAARMMNKVNAAYEQIRNSPAGAANTSGGYEQARDTAYDYYRRQWESRNQYAEYSRERWHPQTVRPGRIILVLLIVYILAQLLFSLLLGGFGRSNRYYSPYGGYYYAYPEDGMPQSQEGGYYYFGQRQGEQPAEE